MAEAVAVAYEEQRQRQIEANKRKLEELQVHRLSAAVREAAAAAKPSSVCPGFLTDSCFLCRSMPSFLSFSGYTLSKSAFSAGQEGEGAGAVGRCRRRRGAATAVRPTRRPPREARVLPCQCELVSLEAFFSLWVFFIQLAFLQVRVRKLKYNARVPLDAAERSYAISKAEELVQDLGSSFPIFIQPMIQSHVTRGFWLVN